jgi:hypothetical protein
MSCTSGTSPYTPYITGIIGLIVGAFSSYFVGTKLASYNEFNKSAAEFRAAFTETIRELEDMKNNIHLSEVLDKAYISHANALIRFRAVLSETDRTQIQKAWNYHCWDNESGTPGKFFKRFEHYNQHEDSAIPFALQNIQNILNFADLR